MLKQNPGYLFNIYLDKRWEFINIFRKFVCDLVYVMFKNQNRAKKIELAVHELIENALKYSPEGSDIHINAREYLSKMIFQIRNFPLEQKRGETYEKLKKDLAELNAQNPEEAYLKRLREPVNNLHLGLARIRHETGADLEIETTEQNLIIINAIFDLSQD